MNAATLRPPWLRLGRVGLPLQITAPRLPFRTESPLCAPIVFPPGLLCRHPSESETREILARICEATDRIDLPAFRSGSSWCARRDVTATLSLPVVKHKGRKWPA